MARIRQTDPETESDEEPEGLPGEILVPAQDADADDDADDPLAGVDQPADASTRLAPLAPARDPVQRFVTEARRYPRLSEDEERQLVASARGQGDLGAARKLVVHNLRLVVSIAYQYRRAWTSLLDLFQEGSVGLMEAVSRWDPNLGTRFGTYAAYWIRAYILRFLMRNARLIHVGNTRAGRKLFFRLGKERAKLIAAGYEPTPKLLAAKLDVDEKDVEEVSGHLASREISMAPHPDDEGLSLDEKLSAPSAQSPEDQAARSMMTDSVRQIMDTFATSLTGARELAIWREHLANAGEPAFLSVLGKRFKVSKQRMGQLTDKLKARFRDLLVAKLGSDFEMSWRPNVDE